MIIDIVVAVVLFISALIAFIRGFVREVLTIAGVVSGLLGAYYVGPLLAPLVRGWFGVGEGVEEIGKLMGIVPYTYVADGLAYLTIFLVIVIVMSILSHFLAEGLKNIGLGAIDRTFGVIFGLARGILLLGILYMVPYTLADQQTRDDFFGESKSQFYLEHTAKFLQKFIPEGAKAELTEGAETIEDAVTTKDKLQKMNLLKKDGTDEKEEELTPDPKTKEGYGENFRDEMNDLFREQQKDELYENYNR